MRSKSRKQVKRIVRKKGKKTRKIRKQCGGVGGCEKYKNEMLRLKSLATRTEVPLDFIRFLFNEDINLEQCSKEHFPNLKKIVDEGKLVISYRGRQNPKIFFPREVHYDFEVNPPQSFYDFFGSGVTKKTCTIEELMTMEPSEYIRCTSESRGRVTGSCGVPSFSEKEDDYSDELRTKYISLFDAIQSKLLSEAEPRYFFIVVGATKNNTARDYNNPNAYTLLINTGPDPPYHSTFEEIITAISERDTLKGIQSFLKGHFPLRYSRRPNSKAILDKLLEMKRNGIQIELTNRMCGTCFPSFYYLVKNGIEYSVGPEQGYGERNTDEVMQCFKDVSN